LSRSRRIHSHTNVVIDAFSAQAELYAMQYSSQARLQPLSWITSAISGSLHKDSTRVLDVCCGTGALSRLLSPHVKSIHGVDLTTAMLNEARSAASGDKLANVTFTEANALKLPFPDNSFDVVCSRLAFHHLPDPLPVLHEMARVLCNNGLVAIIDYVVPPEFLTSRHLQEHRQLCDHLDRLRDPSHARVYTVAEIQAAMRLAKLQCCEELTIRHRHMNLNSWLTNTKTPSGKAVKIIRTLQDDPFFHWLSDQDAPPPDFGSPLQLEVNYRRFKKHNLNISFDNYVAYHTTLFKPYARNAVISFVHTDVLMTAYKS